MDLCFFGCGDGPKRKCANGASACHKIARVDGDFTSAADHDDAAVGGEELHVAREIHARSLEEVRKKDLHAGDHVFDWPPPGFVVAIPLDGGAQAFSEIGVLCRPA